METAKSSNGRVTRAQLKTARHAPGEMGRIFSALLPTREGLSMDDAYFDVMHADRFLSLVFGGIARAEQRHRAKLRTVDENGNPIGNELLIGTEVNQGGAAT